jgi:hypothetical protein
MKLAIASCKYPNTPSLPPTAMLLLAIFLPTLPFYLGFASSLALGAGAASLIIFVGSFQSFCVQRAQLLVIFLTSLLLLMVISIHSLLVSLFLPFDFVRATVSLAPLLLIIAGGVSLSHALRVAPSLHVDRGVKICLGILCLLTILPTLGLLVPPLNSEGSYDKPIFPFTEPSHLALLFTPLYMYCCVATMRQGRAFLLLLGLAIVLLLQNLTLGAGWAMVALVCARGGVLLVAAVSLIVYAANADMSYYVDRLDFSGNTVNLSNLVYVQGWQMIAESLNRSAGFGIGFQQLGLTNPETPATEIIFTLLGRYSNILDGGFTFAKLAGEFGILGLVLSLLLLRGSLLSIRKLRTAAKAPGSLSPLLLLSHAVLACYSLELLLRGTGYFTGSAILLVSSLRIIFITSKPYSTSYLGRFFFGGNFSASKNKSGAPPTSGP